ncbi:hypothetical protein [Tumebacillus avium]|nr:hypothetical protein [Tumebacillus avium]
MSFGTIEDRIQHYLQLKEQRKEMKEKTELLMEEIEQHFETSSIGQG